VTRDCDTFCASDVNDAADDDSAADDSEYWWTISQVCNLVILCDGLDIMILFLLCLKRMSDKVLFWDIELRLKISEEDEKEKEEEKRLAGMYKSQDNNRNDNQ